MLKFNEKTMKKAVVAEEFAVEDENFCISRTGGHDSVMAKPGMELWVINKAECENYGSTEMSLCWIPKFGFETTLASNFVDYIPTESPEEREALGMINTTSKKVESLAKGDEVEWNGEGLPPVGVECEILFKEYPHKGFGLFNILAYHGGAIWVQYTGPLENNGKCYTEECSTLEFRKPESPEQKAERERLEAAIKLHDIANLSYYDGCLPFNCGWNNAGEKVRNMWLSVVDETGYRKQ